MAPIDKSTLLWRSSSVRGTRIGGRRGFCTVRCLLVAPSVSSLITPVGRAAESWYKTPRKWYPLPVGVGALLLGAIQYKKRYITIQQNDDRNDSDEETVTLKHPWQVSPYPNSHLTHSLTHSTLPHRSMFSALYHSATSPVSGATSTASNSPSGYDLMDSASTPGFSTATSTRSSIRTTWPRMSAWETSSIGSSSRARDRSRTLRS